MKNHSQNPELPSKSIAQTTITIVSPFLTPFTSPKNILSSQPLSISTFTSFKPFPTNSSSKSTTPEKSITLPSSGTNKCSSQPIKMEPFTANKSTQTNLSNKSKSTTPKSFKSTACLAILISSSSQTMELMQFDFSKVSKLSKAIIVIHNQLSQCFRWRYKN